MKQPSNHRNHLRTVSDELTRQRTPIGTEWCSLRAPRRWNPAKQLAQNFSQHSTQFYNTQT